MVEGRTIRFRKAVIATGAKSAPVNIGGAAQNGCLLPETLSELAEPPRRLAIIGSGPEACQWAQAFRRLGSQVHLVGRAATVMPQEDPGAGRAVQARLVQEEIRVHLRCEELTVEATGNLRSVLIQQDGRKEKLLVDRVLVCGPRQPNTAGLDLETAAVLYTDQGIVIGDRMQTTNRHIFAAGEVCGSEYAAPQAAMATAGLAAHNALSLVPRRLSRLVIPRCIYTDPQVARIGLTQAEAAARRIEVDTYRIDLAEADGSIAPQRREGFITVYVRRTGRIVGATVVAEDADELITPLQLLMIRKQSLTALAGMIPARPSRLELLTRLAHRRASDRQSCLARLRNALFFPRSGPGTPDKPGD
jgi:pyruvate/2-oxoglutarate dehydrogenase complex dihydrolipoamide dehydrogenase (E3) component